MDDNPAHNSHTTLSQSHTEINSQFIKNTQRLNYEKLSSPFKPPTQNDQIMSSDIQNNNAAFNSQINTNIDASNTKSFADTAAANAYPKMSQAIVLTMIEGLKQIDYLSAIGKLTVPTNIILASRISNNRYCIFLSVKHTKYSRRTC